MRYIFLHYIFETAIAVVSKAFMNAHQIFKKIITFSELFFQFNFSNEKHHQKLFEEHQYPE